MTSKTLLSQVPLLLSLGEMESALTKAIDSGDTDLVYLALFRFGLFDFLSCLRLLFLWSVSAVVSSTFGFGFSFGILCQGLLRGVLPVE